MKRAGSIDQIKNGRFRLRMSIGGKQTTIGYYDTREEADRAALEALDVAADAARDYEGVTLAQFGRRVLTRREAKSLVRDPGSDWSRWDTHVEGDPVALLAVKRVRTDHLYRWVRRLEDKGLATQTIRNCRTLMSVVFNEAVQQGVVRSNPCRELRMRAAGAAPSWTYLSPEEQGRLIFAAASLDRYLVAVAVGTGLRAGELVTLRLSDVLGLDGDSPRLVVRYGSPPARPTKTGKLRVVPLFGLALAALRAWLALLPGFAPDNPHGLVFPRAGGGFRSEAHVLPWASWQATLDDAAIGRRFRWHDLRHTCASSLVSGWWGRRWSLEEVREMLGHSTITITQRYAHLAESALEGAAAATGIRVTTSHREAPDRDPEDGADRTEKQGDFGAEPPSRIELETYGLRNRSITQNTAELLAGDESLTSAALASAPPASAVVTIRRAHAAIYGDHSDVRASRRTAAAEAP